MGGQGSVATLDWKMWGQQALIQLKGGSGEATEFRQLVQVEHPHPESWRFFLYAQPVNYSTDDLWVDWSLVNGVGLTVNTLDPQINLFPGFAYMRFQGPVKPPKWLGAVNPPKYDDTFADNLSQSVDVIVGKSVYISARVRMATTVPYDVSVIVRAAVAPNVFGSNEPRRKPRASQWDPGITPEETGEWSDD